MIFVIDIFSSPVCDVFKYTQYLSDAQAEYAATQHNPAMHKSNSYALGRGVALAVHGSTNLPVAEPL